MATVNTESSKAADRKKSDNGATAIKNGAKNSRLLLSKLAAFQCRLLFGRAFRRWFIEFSELLRRSDPYRFRRCDR